MSLRSLVFWLHLLVVTADVVKWEPFAGQNMGRRLRAWVRPLHTGEAGGLVGQTIAFLASAGGAVLVWTGIALVWRRFRSWRRRAGSSEARSVSRLTQPARVIVAGRHSFPIFQ